MDEALIGTAIKITVLSLTTDMKIFQYRILKVGFLSTCRGHFVRYSLI